MSSYYVEYLINNRIAIEHKSIDDDLYCDLQEVLKLIKRLLEEKKLSQEEHDILNEMSNCAGEAQEMSTNLNLDRPRATRVFVKTCNKLSLILGGIYTDYVYVDRLVKKYNLTESDREKLMKEIKSRYRHTIRRGVEEEN